MYVPAPPLPGLLSYCISAPARPTRDPQAPIYLRTTPEILKPLHPSERDIAKADIVVSWLSTFHDIDIFTVLISVSEMASNPSKLDYITIYMKYHPWGIQQSSQMSPTSVDPNFRPEALKRPDKSHNRLVWTVCPENIP